MDNTRSLPEWDGARYAANTAHHRVHDDRFLAPLELRGNERVVDVGCGSGDFTAKVTALVPEGHVVGVDAQPTMLDEARRVALDNQSFVLLAAQDLAAASTGTARTADAGAATGAADADAGAATGAADAVAATGSADAGAATGTGARTNELAAGCADLVLSRATLHWVPAAEQSLVLEGMHSLLQPGGQLRIECGGAGNVAAIQALLDDVSSAVGGPTDPWCFSDAGWYLDRLQSAGFDVADNDVITVAQRRPFDRAGLEAWIDSQAAMAYEATMSADQRAEFRRLVDARIDEMRRPDGTYDLTYVRLEAYAHRP